MIDNRVVPFRQKDGTIHALGMVFTTDAEVNAEAARRDAAAGFKLSPLDLVVGIPHHKRVDDRDDYTRISQKMFTPVFAKAEEEDTNPWRRDDIREIKAAAFGESEGESRKAFLKRAEREVDEKAEREASLAADAASPERAAAKAWAESHWRSVAFDPLQPLSAVVAAENLVKQANTPGASFGALKAMSVAAVEQQRLLLFDRRDKASAAKLAAQQAFDSANVIPASYGGAPGVGPGDTVTVLDDLQGHREVRIVASDGRVKQSWPESEAPADVRASIQS